MKFHLGRDLPVICALTWFAAIPAAGQNVEGGAVRGGISASRVIASDLPGIDAEEEDNGSAYVLRGALDYDLDFGSTEVSLGYDTAAYFYEDGDRADRWSHRSALAVTNNLSEKVQLFAQASYASNIGTPESGATDQTELFGRLQFAINASNRVRTFAGYRWREYDFDQSEGQGSLYGVEYRFRLAANQYLIAELRRENIESASLRRGYDRTTAEMFYQRPVARGMRLRAGAIASWWDFDGRFAPTGELLKRRSITPEIDFQYATRPGWVIRGRLQKIFRGSNDPRFAEDEQRAIITTGYQF